MNLPASDSSTPGAPPPPPPPFLKPPQPPRKRLPREPASPIVVLGIPMLLCAGAYLYIREHPDKVPRWAAQMVQTTQGYVDKARQRWFSSDGESKKRRARRPGTSTRTPAAARTRSPAAASMSANQTTLYLTNGEWVTGELVRESPQEVVLRWDYGEAPFPRREIAQMVRGAGSAQPAPSDRPRAAAAAAPTHAQVTLYLKNGGMVSGALLHETPDGVILDMDGSEVGFQHAEIQRIVQGAEGSGAGGISMPWEGKGEENAWTYRHDVVVRLMNGAVLDAAIASVAPESVTFTQAIDGGGQVEQTISRADIEQLLFRPIHNERTEQIETTLRGLFPQMRWDTEGLFTIITDSPAPAVRDYRRTIREAATEWYLTFFPLVKDRTPQVQHYIVVFDDWGSYIDYAATDGIPGWLAVGYFSPTDQVLYCFNMVGERFSALLEAAFLGQFRGVRDQISARVKGSRYELTVEGRLSEFLQKLESTHATLRQTYRQFSVDILRHELTHAMFNNWRLQGIVLSTLPAVDGETVKKKRDFLQADDDEQKRRLLESLLTGAQHDEAPQMQADNSWVVEGLAGYMEPSPIGGINRQRLAELQEARRNQQILPLEFLNTFRMGSFPGMATQSALYAYAQSWALCHFFMSRYPDGFLDYLNRLAREQPAADQDTLPWLLEALGQPDQRALEREFLAYVDQWPAEDSFWMKQVQFFLDLRQELSTLAARLW